MIRFLFLFLFFSVSPVLADVYKGEPVSRERKVFSLLEMMKSLASNEERDGEGRELSQSELNRISYFLHFYQFDSLDLFQAKMDFEANDGLRLAGPQGQEIERFLRDFSWIRSRMNAYELDAGLKCKFAYYDWLDWAIRVDPCRNKGGISSAEESALCQGFDASKDRRTVAGLCWDREKFRE